MGNYLYRRNGRFYARLRVPDSLRIFYGRSDLRMSLGTSDHKDAKFRILETVLAWKRDFYRIQEMLDIRQVVTGSPLLHGEGLITIQNAARACGLESLDLLREALNRALELRCIATGWLGVEVAADTLEYDYDNSLILNSALDGNDLAAIVGELFFRPAIFSLLNDSTVTDCLFFRDAKRRCAVVTGLPGITIEVASMLIAKADAEAIRRELASHVTPAMLTSASAPPLAASLTAPIHKYGTMLTSAFLAEFFKGKAGDWSDATKGQMVSMCEVFAELMGDPPLAEIDRVMILRYGERLQALPADLYQIRRRYGVSALADLATIAKTHNLPLMPTARASAYIAKMREAFSWGRNNGFLPESFAIPSARKKEKKRRDQDERQQMTSESLELIFSQSWFQTGRGNKTLENTYREFQPHYFWLPLLGLYTGGRLNELSQLHLKDICCTDAGTWFLDFNLTGLDKIDEPDKRLKSVNSIRTVPLHPELVRLQLPEYVQALKRCGYDRLFPELRHDRVKGYGKQAGKWFNELFLGRKLKIIRNGMQTFHSFRHSFTTGMTTIEPHLPEFVISQLTGHERGMTMAAGRYMKDAGPDKMYHHIAQLQFHLSTIASFDIEEGLVAVKDALDRKSNLERLQKPSSTMK